MSDQRISVFCCQVDLILANGTNMRGETFLQLYGEHSSGSQRVDEILNGDDNFIPIQVESAVELVNLEQVISLRTSYNSEWFALLTLGVKHSVWVEPLHGSAFDATIYANRPNGKTRVKDFLNQQDRFLPFLCDNKVIFLARDKIVRVKD